MNNQTIDGVPRELLERIARAGIWPNEVKELRALLDAPDKKRPAWMDEPFAVAARGEPSGEPVYMKPQYLSVPGLWIECKEGEIHAKPFYAEQPAPVTK